MERGYEFWYLWLKMKEFEDEASQVVEACVEKVVLEAWELYAQEEYADAVAYARRD